MLSVRSGESSNLLLKLWITEEAAGLGVKQKLAVLLKQRAGILDGGPGIDGLDDVHGTMIGPEER